MCHLNLCIKKWGSLSSFRRKRPVSSLNYPAFIENLSSPEGARARAHANHAKNGAQKGCAMQLKGTTLSARIFFVSCWIACTLEMFRFLSAVYVEKTCSIFDRCRALTVYMVYAISQCLRNSGLLVRHSDANKHISKVKS